MLYACVYECMYELFVMREPLQIHLILYYLKTILSKHYIFSSLKTLLTTVYATNDNKYFFKLHTKPIFQNHYVKHFFSFFEDHFLVQSYGYPL